MEFTGTVVVKLPPQDVMASLNNPAVLQAALPHCVGAQAVAPGQFLAKITRKVGPMPVTVEPQITLSPFEDGQSRLTITAGTAFFGRAETAIHIWLEEIPAGTRLTWEGDISATGLAGRLLADRKDKLAIMVRNLFLAFKNKAEALA